MIRFAKDEWMDEKRIGHGAKGKAIDTPEE
jgi:hypothetical protein